MKQPDADTLIEVCDLALQGLRMLAEKQSCYDYEDYQTRLKMISDTEQKQEMVKSIKMQLRDN